MCSVSQLCQYALIWLLEKLKVKNFSRLRREYSHVYTVFERGRRAVRKFSLVCSQKTKIQIYCARVFNLDKNDKIVFLQHGFVRILLNFAHGSLLLGSDINSNRWRREYLKISFSSSVLSLPLTFSLKSRKFEFLLLIFDTMFCKNFLVIFHVQPFTFSLEWFVYRHGFREEGALAAPSHGIKKWRHILRS